MNKKNNKEAYSCGDDYCDLIPNKICDNCGKCLEQEGFDTKAIKISEIAKNIEENEKVLKDILMRDAFKAKVENKESDEERKVRILEEYSNLDDGTYEDAFDHVEYLEELDILDDEEKLDEMTEEIFPGVRRIRHRDI